MPWRVSTSPRSISIVIERLKALLPVAGLDWNQKSSILTGFTENKSKRALRVYPARRRFLLEISGADYFASMGYPDEERFLAAGFDTSDMEARARMAMDAFCDYGLAAVSRDGVVLVTSAGRAIAETDVPTELLLAQFMKFNQITKLSKKRVFPLQILATAFLALDALSLEELGVLTLCDSPEDVIEKAIPAIKKYRDDLTKRSLVKNRSKQKREEQLVLLHARCSEVFEGTELLNLSTVFRDYPDAVARLMQFTGLWTWRGVGPHKRLRVAPGNTEKLRLLAAHPYVIPEPYQNAAPDDVNYITEWLGKLGTVELPWAEPDKLRAVLKERVDALLKATPLPSHKVIELNAIAVAMETSNSSQELAALESTFRGSVLPLIKQHYTEVISKTEDERREILELLQRIESDQQENRALWLEAATWRALSSLDAAPLVQHGCRFDEHLNPLSFGPGGAGSPDMFAECSPQVLVAEVTMLRNNEQWIKEGASVIDHVQTLIHRFSAQRVVGVFICPAVYYRTLWQFYILARESWLGKPIPVVPLTLPQFRQLLTRAYSEKKSFQDVTEQLHNLAQKAGAYSTYEGWRDHLTAEIPALAASTA